MKHFGGVIIGDNVEIGTNAYIDRGIIDYTYIGNNVKIDNLVHVAYNVQIQQNSMLVAGAIICGSADLKKRELYCSRRNSKKSKESGRRCVCL
ncbi:MAG: hypothetical protein HFH65_00100 [Lachnospiraceae bacterium]|nr:hypothetical protein [Lachnospiraceae bacterium]